jgi:prepilin-type N-terminal cleavage/methylation domain-containing protein
MNRQGGFTLIELLAAMTAGSLLLVSLGAAVAQLGGQLSRRSSPETARIDAFAPAFRALVEQAQPVADAGAFEGTDKSLHALVEPPMAAAQAGPLMLDLTVRAAPDNDCIRVRGWARAPDFRDAEDRQHRELSLRSYFNGLPVSAAFPAAAPAIEAAVRFWTWWTGELTALLPEAMRERRPVRPLSDIRTGGSGTTIDRVSGRLGERFHEARTLDALDDDGWAELAGVIHGTRSRLILDVPEVYTTTLLLPAAARGRLDQAVALQMPLIAPLDPASLVWKAAPGPVGDAGQIHVTVAMARAGKIEEVEALFESRGLPVPAIAVETDGEAIELTRGRGSPEEDAARANRRAWLVAALLIASIPLTTMAGAWLLTGMAEGRSESLRKELAPRLSAERRAEAEFQLRRGLSVVFEHPPATATIEGLAIGLPDTDHLLMAGRAGDGALQIAVDSADPDALQTGLSRAPISPRLDATEMVPLDGRPGRMRIELRGAGR